MLLPMDTSARVGTKADPRMHSNVVLPRTARAGTPSPAWRATVRRGLNVALAAIALILLMPLMILIGILIKATSPGPILFTQPRVFVLQTVTFRFDQYESRRQRFDLRRDFALALLDLR